MPKWVRIPGLGVVLTICGSVIGAFVADLPWLVALAIILGSALVLYAVGLALHFLNLFVARTAEEVASRGERIAGAHRAAISDRLDELEVNLKTLGLISHVLAWKSDIKFISRQRETILDVDAEGNDKTVITQVMTRRRPGPPIEMFPVMLSTDRRDVSFEALRYAVETPDIAELSDWERLLINNKLVRFIIYNRLLRPIEYDEQPIQFSHSTCANLDDPTDDWIGIEAGGDTQLLGITVWFPSRSWDVDHVEVFRGPAPASRTRDNTHAYVSVAECAGRLRTRITWSKAEPAANETYFVRWRAHDRGTDSDASANALPAASHTPADPNQGEEGNVVDQD